MILPIIVAPNKSLSLCSEKVENIDDEIRLLVDNMFETMYKKKGIGLAAVQVGVYKRLFVVDVPSDYIPEEGFVNDYIPFGGPFCIINPEIISVSTEVVTLKEGCLSVPDQTDVVTRPRFLTLSYKDYNGKDCILKAQGWLARCLLHEIDHLNGVLYIDHLSKLKQNIMLKKAIKIKQYYENE